MSTLVIGGGASGAMCAVLCARGGERVTLLEKNEKTGKKLFITGKGRCNLTADYAPEEFLDGVVHGNKFLRTAVFSFTPEDTKDFFRAEGVELVTERGNRVFPASGKSSDITRALDRALQKAGVVVHTDCEVVRVGKTAEGFRVNTADGGEFSAARLVIATGGKSYPATGSTGDGYRFAESLGHSVVKPVPSLAGLLTKESVKELEGLSLKNVLFTARGISGPVALSLSAHLNRVSGATLSLDLKPALSDEKLDARVVRDFAERRNAELKTVLRALLPARLNEYVLKAAGLNPEKRVNAVTREERARLVHAVKNLRFSCSGVAPFTEAVVTSGGVSLKELTPRCESRLTPGLYFIGEVIDADAYTGGYNLQIAFSTAAACAADILKKRASDPVDAH